MRGPQLHSAPMPLRPKVRLMTTLFAAAAALSLTACGSSSPEDGIPQDRADSLVSALENLREDFDSDDCSGATAKLGSIREDIAALEDVSDEIRADLGRLADRLQTLLDEDCTEAETTTEETTTSEPTTTTTTTEETTTTDDETKETTEEEPPEDTGGGEGDEETPGNSPETPPGQEDDGSGGFEPGGTGGLSPEDRRSPQASNDVDGKDKEGKAAKEPKKDKKPKERVRR